MILNQKKTKVMLFNFTNNYQFSTRLTLQNENLEIVDRAKLLGVIISNDLKWDANTDSLVKRANMRMELLRKVASFSTSVEDKKIIYILYIRSILEQSCVVWNSSLTGENIEDLERVQKAATKIILGKEYKNYESALEKIGLKNLELRRTDLCLSFAKKCLRNTKTNLMFPQKARIHLMEKRMKEKFEVNHAHIERYKNSSIPYMQRLLNIDEEIRKRTRTPG